MVKNIREKFEHWYKLTHWMAPELTKRGDDEYENQIVQAMYFAYVAGYKKKTKDVRSKARPQNWGTEE